MTQAQLTTRTLVDGFAATECPRWHDGRLYFSDMNGGTVHSVTPDGRCEAVAEVVGRAGGLGWLPSGELLVVSQEDRRVLRVVDGRTEVYADLASLGDPPLNDMYVAPDGTAYVGDMGFDIHEFGHLMTAGSQGAAMALYRTSPVWRISPDREVAVAVPAAAFPNGIVAGPGGATVLLAESFGMALTLFDVEPQGGNLVNARPYAPLGFAPDGIALDAEGCVWVADPTNRRAVRVAPGGEELESVTSELICLSVALGGPELRTLFICSTDVTDPEQSRRSRQSRIETTVVATPGAA